MSEELLPCPFCGGEADFKVFPNDICNVVCRDCHIGTRFESIYDYKTTVKAWNTRAERTCKIDGTYDDEFGIYDHLSCGHVAMRQWPEKTNFCPNCGAKVVE